MNKSLEFVNIWEENKPEFNVIVKHPQCGDLAVKYDPDAEYQVTRQRINNDCGNFPYVSVSGSRPFSRNWTNLIILLGLFLLF